MVYIVMKRSRVQSQRRLIGAALLLVLLFRAYVPIGFMPSAGFLALKICPEGLPQLVQHHHHGGESHDAFEHCPFGSAPAAGPAPHLVSLPPRVPPLAVAPIVDAAALLLSRSDRAHPSTGPPFLS